jgi:putative ubiquitin-RnfH superfamily antitoxin RatB of RatAB toxin-antitoxin module
MEKPDNPTIAVEVAYALPERQRIIKLQVRPGCTALEAVRQSGIVREFPGLDIETADMGIFAKNLDGKQLALPAEYVLKARDRVEIYRPLQADPKAARQQRAAKAKDKKAGEGENARGQSESDATGIATE